MLLMLTICGRSRDILKTFREVFSNSHFFVDHKLCISIVFDFSWEHCNTQEKLETGYAKFGGMLRCIIVQVEVFYLYFILLTSPCNKSDTTKKSVHIFTGVQVGTPQQLASITAGPKRWIYISKSFVWKSGSSLPLLTNSRKYHNIP